MYPYLEPHGLILKIDHEKIDEMPESVVAQDRDYWHSRVATLLGDWLNEDTPVKTVTEFADKVHVRRNFGGFTGDKGFVENEDARKFVSKLRCSIAAVYAWRAKNSKSNDEQDRMQKAADLAYRQAIALCPDNPEAVFAYGNLLVTSHRTDDAILVASAALAASPKNHQLETLISQLKIFAKKLKRRDSGFEYPPARTASHAPPPRPCA